MPRHPKHPHLDGTTWFDKGEFRLLLLGNNPPTKMVDEVYPVNHDPGDEDDSNNKRKN